MDERESADICPDKQHPGLTGLWSYVIEAYAERGPEKLWLEVVFVAR